jgi:dTMP kinase
MARLRSLGKPGRLRSRGRFITFEGTEGCGKSTQIRLLAERLEALRRPVRRLREPGSTPIGEELRHTLQHSAANGAMTAETELLLMCAARAQLVREVIRPTLAAGQWVVCDRFCDSTTAYQGYGRELDLGVVGQVIDLAVGETRPDLTLLLHVPVAVSEARRRRRGGVRDRMEEAGRAFFRRVQRGYLAIAAAEPMRVRVIDATRSIEVVAAQVWTAVAPLVGKT